MIPTPIRAIVDARDENTCVCCGQPSTDRHHRRFGMGGSSLPDHHTPQNLVSLCGFGNTSGCHGRAHRENAWALANGYRVPRDTDPRTVPITHHAWGVCWLLEDGSVSLDPMDVAEPPPNIGDTCCGKCVGGTCYVDEVTGA